MGKSNSEVGHAKNAANLVKLQQITVEMGPLYQPTNTKIQPTAFNTFTLKVTENAQQFAELVQPYKDAVELYVKIHSNHYSSVAPGL